MILVGVLVVGAAYLVDGRLLKTQVAPGGDTSTVKDWESVDAPGLDNELVGPIRFCHTPSPTSSPVSSPLAYAGRVLGELWPSPSVTPECREGYVADLYKEYEYSLDKGENNIRREFVNGLDPGYILTAVCEGNPSPPYCDDVAVGCAWMEYVDVFDPTLRGLYEQVSGLYRLVEGGYVYPDGLGTPETRQWVPGVYPAPTVSNDELFFELGMSLWDLSAEDKQVLSEWHPKLLETAQRQISKTEEHEEVHWEIFEKYLPNYVAMINRPWYDTSWSVKSLSSLEDLIKEEFNNGWQAVAVLEDAEHEAFHEWENEQIGEAWGDIVPYDGMDNILCSYMKGMVGVFGLLVTGEGYARADYDHTGTGGRIIVTDDYAAKEYFTNADIRIEASPKPGYKFEQWKSPIFDEPCTGCAGTTKSVCTIQIGTRGDICEAVFVPIATSLPSETPSETPEIDD